MTDREPKNDSDSGSDGPSERASDHGPKSDREPRSEPRPGASKARAAPASRPGFVTMPADLRAFYRPDAAGIKLSDMPGAMAAAEKLREAGRGPDVLFDNLREQAPREPSANDNRAEQAIVELPASASPWAHDAAAAKDAAAATVDKSALPSATAAGATAPSSRPPPSVVGETGPTSSAKVAASTRASAKAAASTRASASTSKRDRRWPVVVLVALSFAAIVVVLAWARDDSSTPVASTPTGAAPDLTGSRPVVTTDPRATATGAPMTTGASTGATAQLPTMNTASATGTGSAASTTSSAGTTSVTRPVPKVSGDPYVDAGVLPKATVEPAPSTAPVTSSAPSAPPQASTGVLPFFELKEKK